MVWFGMVCMVWCGMTTCFLKDVKSTKALMDKLELFSRCSGLEINKSKTEVLWLGSMKECKQNLLVSNGLTNQFWP